MTLKEGEWFKATDGRKAMILLADEALSEVCNVMIDSGRAAFCI
jgi:hypothetical protein